jgi:hypothetical protein
MEAHIGIANGDELHQIQTTQIHENGNEQGQRQKIVEGETRDVV